MAKSLGSRRQKDISRLVRERKQNLKAKLEHDRSKWQGKKGK